MKTSSTLTGPTPGRTGPPSRGLAATILAAATFAALLPLASPLAFAGEPREEGIVTVSGTASVDRPPDLAVVRVGIQAQSPEASDAQQEANAVAASILEGLEREGVPSSDVQTARIQLFPVYESAQPGGSRGGEPRVVGYRATNTVSITLRDLESIGPVIDRAIEAGANRIDSIDLRLDDDAEARREALAAAVLDARVKAETIAEALGRRLGPIVDVTEGGVSAPPVLYREMAAMGRMAADNATPVATGSLTVSASVTVRYRLAPTE